jgi:MOSC domain-containing protein YiiM
MATLQMFARAKIRERNIMSGAVIVSVSLSTVHSFSKVVRPRVTLVAGLGIEGDAHNGVTVKHRSRVAADPSQPNLRQVHLIHAELIDALNRSGFSIRPGDVGENILTRNLDLLSLPQGTRLHIGDEAVLQVTGLRNPCAQLDDFQEGLTAAMLDRASDGSMIRKSGVMSIVLRGGEIGPGDDIRVEVPPLPHEKLQRV